MVPSNSSAALTMDQCSVYANPSPSPHPPQHTLGSMENGGRNPRDGGGNLRDGEGNPRQQQAYSRGTVQDSPAESWLHCGLGQSNHCQCWVRHSVTFSSVRLANSKQVKLDDVRLWGHGALSPFLPAPLPPSPMVSAGGPGTLLSL
jgi:hypothetical protein